MFGALFLAVSSLACGEGLGSGRPGSGIRSLHALEAAVGGHGGEGLFVALDRLLDVGVAVDGRNPAVVARTVDAVVQERAAQAVIEIAAARAIEAGEAGLALE